MADERLLIGDFAARTRLSAKALRRYDELGLLVPAHVDPFTGYRWYAPEQVRRARLVALLRHLDMPLARIGQVLELPAGQAAAAVREHWAERERAAAARRPVVSYLCALLEGTDDTMERVYEVLLREVPERAVLSAVRYVHADRAGAVLGELLGRMSQAGPGLRGLAGCPY